jgi:hypothetical protein
LSFPYLSFPYLSFPYLCAAMNISRQLSLSLVFVSTTAGALLSPQATQAQYGYNYNNNGYLLEQTQRACEQAAYSRGLRVLEASRPYATGNNRAETTLLVAQNNNWNNNNWGRDQQRVRCEYNLSANRAFLDNIYAGGNNWGNGNWNGQPRFLGAIQLGYRENDVNGINIGNCNNRNSRIREVQLRARRGAVDLDRMRVQFGNGETERLNNLPKTLDQGQASRWIRLDDGERRCVTQVVIQGDTRDFSRQQAVVEVWGR